jgi:hypothetical protein
MARDWVERTTQHSFIEPALHNDSRSAISTAIFGKGLFEHVAKAGRSLASPSAPAAAMPAGTCIPRRSMR